MLECDRESLKERFIEYVSAYETTIIRTLALCVSSSNDIESLCRFDVLANLLEKQTFAL